LPTFARGVPSLRGSVDRPRDSLHRGSAGNPRSPNKVKALPQLAGRKSSSLNFFIRPLQSTYDFLLADACVLPASLRTDSKFRPCAAYHHGTFCADAAFCDPLFATPSPCS